MKQKHHSWSDEMCLRFAEAYDSEQAAQIGEPAPWTAADLDPAQRAEVISCVRAGLGAMALQAIRERKVTG